MIIFSILLCLFPFDRAYAYIDPGTGSYIVQVLIGLIFGAGYVIKVFWGRIIKFFKERFLKKESEK